MTNLPEHRHSADCGCYLPDTADAHHRITDAPHRITDAHHPASPPPPVIHQHIHQAPPDRTLQRAALGAGLGGGAVTAGVYFGPLLVTTLTALAANLAVLALIVTAAGWAVVSVVRTVGSPEGDRAARNLRRRKNR